MKWLRSTYYWALAWYQAWCDRRTLKKIFRKMQENLQPFSERQTELYTRIETDPKGYLATQAALRFVLIAPEDLANEIEELRE